METFTIAVWVTSGPRDRTNCMGEWGRRSITVQASDFAAAVYKIIAMVGRNNYGGLVRSKG